MLAICFLTVPASESLSKICCVEGAVDFSSFSSVDSSFTINPSLPTEPSPLYHRPCQFFSPNGRYNSWNILLPMCDRINVISLYYHCYIAVPSLSHHRPVAVTDLSRCVNLPFVFKHAICLYAYDIAQWDCGRINSDRLCHLAIHLPTDAGCRFVLSPNTV